MMLLLCDSFWKVAHSLVAWKRDGRVLVPILVLVPVVLVVLVLVLVLFVDKIPPIPGLESPLSLTCA